MSKNASVWHPLKNMNVEATIKYDREKKATEIKYKDGYKVTDESYIEDILYESGLIKEKSTSWME